MRWSDMAGGSTPAHHTAHLRSYLEQHDTSQRTYDSI